MQSKSKMTPTKKQLKIMKEAWKQLQKDFSEFLKLVEASEKWLEKETGIKGIGFVAFDNEFIGIGTTDRKMRLVCGEELEK